MLRLNINDIVADPNWLFSGISPLLQEIRRERQIEFFAEGFRLWDMFRWAAVDELIIGKRPYGAYRQQFLDKYEQGLTNEQGNLLVTEQAYNNLVQQHVTEDGYFDPYRRYNFEGYNFNPGRDYLQPIPTDQLTLNPALTQNPGW